MLFNQHIIRTDFQYPVISMFQSYRKIQKTAIITGRERVPALLKDDWNNNLGTPSSSITC